MNLRSESREREGNPLGLMNQFQKNLFTRSPSISTTVRIWEMLALTLSTSELRLPTLSVVKDNRSWDRDQETLTREEYTSEKWGSYFPYEIQRC